MLFILYHVKLGDTVLHFLSKYDLWTEIKSYYKFSVTFSQNPIPILIHACGFPFSSKTLKCTSPLQNGRSAVWNFIVGMRKWNLYFWNKFNHLHFPVNLDSLSLSQGRHCDCRILIDIPLINHWYQINKFWIYISLSLI